MTSSRAEPLFPYRYRSTESLLNLHLPTRSTRTLDTAAIQSFPVFTDLSSFITQSCNLPKSLIAEHPHQAIRPEGKIVARLTDEDLTKQFTLTVPYV